ncbi:hypothetical protein [Saccharothrix sp. ST-888]|uniref:hypothetical protein n=1 Tax=Saccharothrix sp. ST-888 TaxID=1427391 RepID=UPI0005EC95BD|nr:hypothetical protein [Saccharothrix sp. ST-888]KJK57474.1 hypothetical protein UK12_16475 [Saccharothrix sp. ST-888]
MNLARTADEALLEHLVAPSRRMPLPEAEPEDAITDEACREPKLPTIRARFSNWDKTFADPRLCAVIADRLTFKGTLIQTGTSSCRLNATENEYRSSRWS